MDNRKFEKLIDMIINENEDKARELFHQIVVEKSREIYESIMDEEMMDEEDGMGGQVGDLMDEISSEESGVMEDDMEGEEEEEYDFTDADGEEVEGEEEEDFEDDGEEHEDLEDEVHDLEDRVVSIEDKLDDLLAQFEKEMGGSDEEEMDDEEMDDEEEAMMEAVQLQAVKVTHGDDGSQKRSPTAFNSGKAGMDSKPVNFSGGGQESGRSAPSTKDVKGAGSFKNAPGHKSQDLGKAPAPTKSQASGVNTKSPVAK